MLTITLQTCWRKLIPALFVFASCNNRQSHSTEITENAEIEGAMEYEFNLLKNPYTGKIPHNARSLSLNQAQDIFKKQSQDRLLSETANIYRFQGPDNMGGRTRSVVYDLRFNGTTNTTMFGGGVSGGVFKSTDNGVRWTRVSPASANCSVTSIAQDPRPGHQDTWYFGTGEFFGQNAIGDGIYKSTDNGETWTRMVNSNTGIFQQFDRSEDYIYKVAVAPNGFVYMACVAGIFRSGNEGMHWAPVLAGTSSSFFQTTDIAISSTGTLYAAFAGANGADVKGIWRSYNGDPGTWTRIAGEPGVPSTWPTSYGRIVIALAPSNENLMYVLVQMNPLNCIQNNQGAGLFLWNNATTTWEDRTVNFPNCQNGYDFRVQSGYCMCIAVKPDDPNVVFAGGINLERSTNGFSSPASPGAIIRMLGIHPDVHSLVFQPGQPATLVVGTDGGIFRTINCSDTYPTFGGLNDGFRTYQYYYVTLDPRAGNNKVLGGAQDNGTTRNINGDGILFEEVYPGDGVSVGLSNPINGETFEYYGRDGGQIRRRNASSTFAGSDIRPTETDNASGLPITLFLLDPDNTEYIYYANNNRLFRNTSASTADRFNWTALTGVEGRVGIISSLAVARGSYNPTTSSLFIGDQTGHLYRLDDPANTSSSTIPVNITGSSFPPGNIRSIAVNPRNDDTVLVSYSNYGVTSIFWTGNANATTPTWINVERNLTLPSIRSSATAVVGNSVEYFVGTEVGLFRSSNPITTDWSPEGVPEIGFALVNSLALRPSDNRLLIGTYGNGMLATTLGTGGTLPLSLVDFRGKEEDDKVILRWRTTSENNTDRFEIERSPNGTNFSKIASVAAAGNSNISRYYQYADKQAIMGENYYRLKMVDSDNRFTYSNIIMIDLTVNKRGIFVSNPFDNQITVRFSKPPSGIIQIALADVSGKIIFSKMVKSEQKIQLDISKINLAQGMYLLKIEADNKTFTWKLLKQM